MGGSELAEVAPKAVDGGTSVFVVVRAFHGRWALWSLVVLGGIVPEAELHGVVLELVR